MDLERAEEAYAEAAARQETASQAVEEAEQDERREWIGIAIGGAAGAAARVGRGVRRLLDEVAEAEKSVPPAVTANVAARRARAELARAVEETKEAQAAMEAARDHVERLEAEAEMLGCGQAAQTEG